MVPSIFFNNSPVIIAPDANIEVAASRILWGKYYNAGQVNTSFFKKKTLNE
jgi:acyl-CoA reductase-like NAD-dependent aldehyde dehydrogenase